MKESLKSLLAKAGSNVIEIAKLLKVDKITAGGYINEYQPVPPHIRRKIEDFLSVKPAAAQVIPKGECEGCILPMKHEGQTCSGTIDENPRRCENYIAEEKPITAATEPTRPAANTGNASVGGGDGKESVKQDPNQTNLLLDPDKKAKPKPRRGRRKKKQ